MKQISIITAVITIMLIVCGCGEYKSTKDFRITRTTHNFISQDYQIEKIRFKSKILNQTCNFQVFRPKYITSKDSVRIFYIIDGSISIEKFQYLRMYFKDYDSEFISVIIPKIKSHNANFYIEEADKYLSFLTKEIMPRVETDYIRISRILLGNSKAGAFTVYTLLNQPSLFSIYYVRKPTSISQLIKEDFRSSDTLSLKKARLDISTNFTDSARVLKEFTELKNLLNQNVHLTYYPKLTFESFNFFDNF